MNLNLQNGFELVSTDSIVDYCQEDWMFKNMAERYTDIFYKEFVKKAESTDDIDIIDSIYHNTIKKAIKEICDLIIVGKYNIINYNATKFAAEYYEENERWEEFVEFIEKENNKIDSDLNYKITSRNMYSGARVTGGGFGLSGAAKGIFIAAGINHALDLREQKVKEKGNRKDIEDSIALKTELLDINEDVILDIVNDSIYYGVREALNDFLCDKVDGYQRYEVDSESADAIFENMKLLSSEESIEALVHAFEANPVDERIYLSLLENKKVKLDDLDNFCQYICYPLNKLKESFLEKSYYELFEGLQEPSVGLREVDEKYIKALKKIKSSYEKIAKRYRLTDVEKYKDDEQHLTKKIEKAQSDLDALNDKKMRADPAWQEEHLDELDIYQLSRLMKAYEDMPSKSSEAGKKKLEKKMAIYREVDRRLFELCGDTDKWTYKKYDQLDAAKQKYADWKIYNRQYNEFDLDKLKYDGLRKTGDLLFTEKEKKALEFLNEYFVIVDSTCGVYRFCCGCSFHMDVDVLKVGLDTGLRYKSIGYDVGYDKNNDFGIILNFWREIEYKKSMTIKVKEDVPKDQYESIKKPILDNWMILINALSKLDYVLNGESIHEILQRQEKEERAIERQKEKERREAEKERREAEKLRAEKEAEEKAKEEERRKAEEERQRILKEKERQRKEAEKKAKEELRRYKEEQRQKKHDEAREKAISEAEAQGIPFDENEWEKKYKKELEQEKKEQEIKRQKDRKMGIIFGVIFAIALIPVAIFALNWLNQVYENTESKLAAWFTLAALVVVWIMTNSQKYNFDIKKKTRSALADCAAMHFFASLGVIVLLAVIFRWNVILAFVISYLVYGVGCRISLKKRFDEKE